MAVDEPAAPPGGELRPIFVVSGGMGASGELLVRTALAQFTDARVPVVLVPRIRDAARIDAVLDRAAAMRGMIVHTLVDPQLRAALAERARARGIVELDLMGPLLQRLAGLIGQEPAHQPGLYRQLHQAYFGRIASMEFAVAHDDGQRIEELAQAEIVVVGVSRAGKTPLSMYLAMQGWKVANVPYVAGIELPRELLEVDRRRVVGLTIEPGQLIAHRQWRMRRMGMPKDAGYAAPDELYDEVEEARAFFRRRGYAIIDVTDKPLESIAEEVIAAITRRTES